MNDMVKILQKEDIEYLRSITTKLDQMNARIIERLTLEGISVEDSEEAIYFGMLTHSLEKMNQYYNY